MKSSIFALLALAVGAFASPVDSAAISKRAGPSGQSDSALLSTARLIAAATGRVIKPSGGTSVDQGAGIQL